MVIKTDTLISASKNINDANSALYESGDGANALNLSIRAYVDLLTFANDFYSTEKKFSNRRLVHILHVILQRRIIEIVTFAIKSSSYKIPSKRDVFALRMLNNIGMTDKTDVIINRLNQLSEDNDLNRKSSLQSVTSLPEGFPSDKHLPQALNLLDTSKLDGFNSLIGIDEIVVKVDVSVRDALESKKSISMILHGPPGTGKTSLAMAVGSQYNIPVISIAASGLGGMYVGERESNLNKIFEYINEINSNLVLFIDEADSFMRDENINDTIGTRMVRKTIVDYVFNLITENKSNKVVVLVMATNYYERIMKSIRELSKEVLIPLPDENSMIAVVEFYRKLYKLNMTERKSKSIAQDCFLREFSPSHVNLLFRRISSKTIYRLLTESTSYVPIDNGVFELLEPKFTLDNNVSNESSKRILIFDDCKILYRLNNDVSITGEFFKDDLLPLLCSEIDFDSIKKFSIKPNEIQNISNFISENYTSPIPSIPSTPTVNIISDLNSLTSDENKTGNGDVVSSTNQATVKDEDIFIDEMILDADSNIISNYEKALLDPNFNFNIFNSSDYNFVGFTSPPLPPPPPPN